MASSAQTAETSHYMFSLEDIKQLIEQSTSEEDTISYVKLLSKLETFGKETIIMRRVSEIKQTIEDTYVHFSPEEHLRLLTEPTYNEIIPKIFIGPFTQAIRVYDVNSEMISTTGSMIDYIIDLSTHPNENEYLTKVPKIKLTVDVDSDVESERTLSNIMDIVTFIRIYTERKFLIQDINGDNEAVVFTAIYLMINNKMSLIESLVFIKEANTLTNLHDKYLAFLVKYEQQIISHRS
uniref:Uncharacterized protein n=1 Tax=viral metagenome TaxID=1070528 RepID=A0A6C0J4J5_9ZZZZ